MAHSASIFELYGVLDDIKGQAYCWLIELVAIVQQALVYRLKEWKLLARIDGIKQLNEQEADRSDKRDVKRSPLKELGQYLSRL